MSNPPVAFILFSSLRGAVLFSLFPLRAQSISLQADLLELLLPSLSQFSLNELKKCSFSLFHFLLLVQRRTNANEKLVPMKMKTGNFTMELHHTRTHTHTHTGDPLLAFWRHSEASKESGQKSSFVSPSQLPLTPASPQRPGVEINTKPTSSFYFVSFLIDIICWGFSTKTMPSMGVSRVCRGLQS